MIKRRSFLTSAAAVLPAIAVAQPKGAKLIVHVTYAGAATWDRKHVMGCAIWPSTEFKKNRSAKVLAHTIVDPVTKIATFEEVTAGTVYLTCLLDTTGNWDGNENIPEGSLVGAYGDPGEPKAVHLAPGKATKVSMTWGKTKEVLPKA